MHDHHGPGAGCVWGGCNKGHCETHEVMTVNVGYGNFSWEPSTSYCNKLIRSEVMNYSTQNHEIVILFKCWCVFKDPWFKALLSLLFNLLIKADLLSSLSSIYWHLEHTDLLVYDCPNFTVSSKAKERRWWKSSLPKTPFLTGHLCALKTHSQC